MWAQVVSYTHSNGFLSSAKFCVDLLRRLWPSRCDITVKTLWSSNLSCCPALLGAWKITNTKQETISPYLNQKLSLKPRSYTVWRPLEQAFNQLANENLSFSDRWLLNYEYCFPNVSPHCLTHHCPYDRNKSFLLESWTRILDFLKCNSSSTSFLGNFSLTLCFSVWQPNTHMKRTKNCQESQQNKSTLDWLYLQGKTFQSLSPVLMQKPQEAGCPQTALICKLNALKDTFCQVFSVYSGWVSEF